MIKHTDINDKLLPNFCQIDYKSYSQKWFCEFQEISMKKLVQFILEMEMENVRKKQKKLEKRVLKLREILSRPDS